MIVRPLTLAMALEVAGDLCARHRAEILRTSDLTGWAHARVQLNGMAWGIVAGGRTLAIFGLLFDDTMGTLWIAGREGWGRHLKHVLRVWRAVRTDAKALGFERFRCQVYADNAPARRLVERLGFNRAVPCDGLITYGMVAS